ncbi:MAG: serine hydrolase, partial [Vicinamibacterales bacterium]
MDALANTLNDMCDVQPFHVGWAVEDLRSGWRASRNGDVVTPSASTRKVAILMTALGDAHSGRLDL